MASLSILTIGSELLDGRVQDTNAQFICELFTNAGFAVQNILSCDDSIDDITRALQYLSASSEIVIISGGLGPTSDDLTREAMSKYCAQKLVLHDPSLDKIKDLFRKRGRKFEPCNEKQALIPTSATVIDNPVGTAPGFYMQHKNNVGTNVLYFSLPGVPSELTKMMHESVLPEVLKRFKTQHLYQKAFKIFALPESVVNGKISSLSLPSSVTVSYRAKFPEIHLILKSRSTDVNELAVKVRNAIGYEHIFTEDLNESFEANLHKIILDKGISIAGAESCTGGQISTLLTNTPGASKYFLGTLVTYSNSIKKDLLGVDMKTLQQHGAVSSQVAYEMAKHAREHFGSDLAYSVTGIAGPDGGSQEKPIGLFYIGLANSAGVSVLKCFHPSSRKHIRTFAAYMALDVIRRFLLSLPAHKDANIQ